VSSGQSKTEKLEEMIPVPITDFVVGDTMPVNVYVRLGDTKFVQVAKPGDKADPERLSSYKDKSAQYLWVKKHQYGELLKTGLQIAGFLIQSDSLSGPQKTTLLTSVAKPVFSQLEKQGLSFETYAHAKQIVDATIALAENHNDLAELFESLKDCSDELLKHSLAVCCVSTIIAQNMKWDSRSTLEKLTLGALLHDIGKKGLPSELLKKPKIKMSFDEMQAYEQHPYKGMQMLLSLGNVPDDVVSIVFEHHENALGQGYPRKLRNLKIHPLARIVGLADDFVSLTMENPNCPLPKTPREALMTIEVTMGQPHNRDCFRSLQRAITKEFAHQTLKKKAG